MAQVKHLTQDELEFLRREMRKTFLEASPHVRELKANAYLPNYEALQQHMRSRLKAPYQLSVGAARLRKLFYYTDPAVCGEDQLKKARFGEDFLDACYLYISDNRLGRAGWRGHRPGSGTPHKRPGRNILWIAMTAMAIIFLAIAIKGRLSNTIQEEAWVETFDRTGLDHLLQKGWEILFYDSVLWKKQLRPGFLTIYATPGTLWVTEPDSPPSIDNLLLRRVYSDCFSAEVKLVDFHPKAPYEQAGIIMLGADKEPLPYISLTRYYGSRAEGAIPSLRQGIGSACIVRNKAIKNNKTIGERLWQNGVQAVKPLFVPNAEPVDTVWLKVEVRGGECSFYFRINDKNREYYQLANNDYNKHKDNLAQYALPMKLGYIGFGAFGAGSKAYPSIFPDTVPCFVDEFSFTPCPEK